MPTYWTEERVVEALEAWSLEHGAPPTVTDWRNATPTTPSAVTVADRFGSWNSALQAHVHRGASRARYYLARPQSGPATRERPGPWPTTTGAP